MLMVEFDALLENVTVPLAVPAAFGVNASVRVELCPAAMVAGNAGEVTEN